MSFTHPLARIVIAYDASPPADAALAGAIALAEQFGGDVVVSHVSDGWAPSTIPLPTQASRNVHDHAAAVEGLDDCRRHVLRHVSERVAFARVSVSADFSTNTTVAGVLDTARRWNATAIAVGIRDIGDGARVMTGSVTDGILRGAALPVLVAREGKAPLAGGLRRVVVGIDGTDPSNGAVLFATALAADASVRLIFCSVVDETGDAGHAGARRALDGALEYANAAGIFPDTDVVEAGTASAGVRDAALRHRADAIVLGTHGRTHIDRFVFGSTAENVVRHSEVPVLVVPQRANLLTSIASTAVAAHR